MARGVRRGDDAHHAEEAVARRLAELEDEEEAEPPFRLSDLGVEDPFVFVIFWVLSIVVFVQFFSRYALNSSIAWTEEIARYLLIAVTFLGSAIAVRKNTHIHVEFFYRYLSPAAARALSTVVDLVRLAFLAFATYLAWKVLTLMGSQRMTSVNVPMSVLYWVVVVGFAAMTIRAVQVTWRHWRQGYSDLDAIHRPDRPPPTT